MRLKWHIRLSQTPKDGEEDAFLQGAAGAILNLNKKKLFGNYLKHPLMLGLKRNVY